ARHRILAHRPPHPLSLLHRPRPARDLHSLPTRRSSDLSTAATASRISRITSPPCLSCSSTIAASSRRATSYSDMNLSSRIRMGRSEEHTSELQSLAYLVCRLLLEKKKKAPAQRPSTTVV